ncbi:Membrane-bound lytic murein transglycosylase B precursor [Sulfitobacter sp. THAF37]|uniref:lytic murein transglycosylase n=1 Tax=Sulfitobacter sp. THAF37 TaxID=2587855 RepID=UPI001267F471|nr:lytic murein transglycosylase [Sulfitobacter sp. THAF37]QFT58345.1 Membrane-bound lytic murein transglycosylase B precursor [Sulfitobacter sp. THAF37]
MRGRIGLSVALVCLGTFAIAQKAPDVSARPPERLVSAVSGDDAASGTTGELRAWVARFRDRALQEGVDGAVYDRALQDVAYDAQVVRRDRNQAEFTKTIWDYLDTAVSDVRIANGKAALQKWNGALSQIEETYGVEKEIVVAIWGLESAYGTFRGQNSVLNSMATLAYDGRRAEFFEDQLLAALRILQAGDTTKSDLIGSWAGAMGHTQFMPTSFQDHAVDYDGDGKRDIWGDDPVDALASTAAYLKHHGWTRGQPWGIEVQIADGFDYMLARRSLRKMPSEWATLGVTRPGGTAVKDYGLASVLLPGGADGAAFLVFSNFAVLESYNTADAYVVAVGHLADRIKGRSAFEHGWPRHLRVLTFDERIELQKRLTSAGYDTEKIDAKMGPLTVDAIRRFQADQGVLPDGYPSLKVLDRLRAL